MPNDNSLFEMCTSIEAASSDDHFAFIHEIAFEKPRPDSCLAGHNQNDPEHHLPNQFLVQSHVFVPAANGLLSLKHQDWRA